MSKDDKVKIAEALLKIMPPERVNISSTDYNIGLAAGKLDMWRAASNAVMDAVEAMEVGK